MKQSLRLALPPLSQLNAQSIIAFALLDRHGKVLRSGEQSLDKLAAALPSRQVQAILHPGDAVVATVELPPLPAGRLEAAILARVEPMVLSELDDLCIAHGPRLPDGRIQVAWAGRRPLRGAWQNLHDAGLEVQALVPAELALPAQDPHPQQPLRLPADARWQAALPDWSLARPELRPNQQARRWRPGLRWAAAAALVWLAGLHWHAAQLRGEIQTLQKQTEQTVRAAFPSLSVLLDPLRQTRNQLAQLRQTHGLSAQDDFMPLALDSARVLAFAEGHVTTLHYRDQSLSLTLAEGYAPPADESALEARAAAASLVLNKDAEQPHVWHLRRNTVNTPERRP